MDVYSRTAAESILVLGENATDLNSAAESIAAQVPTASITSVSELPDFRQVLADKSFDIVVLDHSIVDDSGADLIQELKIKEDDPSILVVFSSNNPGQIADAFNSGCRHCIIKDEQWLEKIGPAVRGLLRHRRREDGNATLLAKLTEANALLEEKNQRLDEFTKTVAHDIRGPLGAITMRLEYMRDVYADDVDERFRSMLESSYSSARRLINVVQAMYEYAKLGTRALTIEKIELAEFIEEVIRDLDFSRDVNLKIGIGEFPTVWGDRNLLRKVFSNLIGNSVKFCDKPSVKINIGQNLIVKRSLADFCEIFIEDNGPGIAKEDLKDLFVMFRRGGDANQEIEGTGIGLAVVKRIIELHFGKVRVESEPGQGARFVFSLPMNQINLQV